VRLLVQPPRGKPAAVTAAARIATGEIVLLTDVRQLVERDSLAFLASNFADETVGVVSGDLVIRAPGTLAGRDIGLYWRYETWIRDRLGRLDSTFGATGPFYAIRRELLAPVPDHVLLDDMYVPLVAFFRGYRAIVDRRAIAYDYPTSRAVEFRRKLRTLAGNYQILGHFPALLGPRNRMWADYVSYKLGRLLLPFILVWIAVASFALPAPWRTLVVGGQALFYLLGGLDALVPEGARVKRLTSPIGTFVTMMIAAVGALAILFVPAQRFWTVTSTRSPDALAG
jgi:cellulose synthase/poly-beta-1,6-N-acetylglucosamine synthase-like glycosyltransferase